MNTESVQNTPSSSISKKRELTSPDFDIDSKKNKLLSASSESDLDSSVIDMSITEKQQETMAMAMATPLPMEETSETSDTPHITIPPSEMLKISLMLKETFRGEVEAMVDSVVKGVLSGLQERITVLENANAGLLAENKSLTSKVASLEKQIEQTEQYSRRNCLRISGLKEEVNEDTDTLVMNIATTIGSEIQITDIDRSHRVGSPRQQRDRPRDVIVKFATYRSRQNFFKRRTALKDSGYRGVFVNEDLTRQRSALLYEARKLFKSSVVKGAWSSDGTILVRDRSDRVHRINALSDLDVFVAHQVPAAVPR
ncbi:MAG: hypothetical protein AB2693_31740 [Candidatus Thiodiazotropha sp.]